MMLKNARAEKLAQEYVSRCGDVVEAYKVAYPEIAEGKTDARLKKLFATNFAKDALFWRRVAELQKPVERQIALNAVAVFHELSAIATADATKLSSVRTGYVECMGGCDDGKSGPFTPICEECSKPRRLGKYVHIENTNELSAHDKKLYKSAETTKYGIKVHLRDQDAALLNLAKIHGMLTERIKLTYDDDPVLPPLPDDPNEAARAYNDLVKGT